jgi:hypothetical protein
VLRLSSDCRIRLVMLALSFSTRSTATSFNLADDRPYAVHRAV